MLFQYFDHSKDVKHDISDNDDSYECTPIDVLFLFCLDLNIFVLNLLFFVDIYVSNECVKAQHKKVCEEFKTTVAKECPFHAIEVLVFFNHSSNYHSIN
jgi:hypothetical protein